MKLIIIAAIGKNKELGINNKLIWNLPGDLKFFKEKTTGHTIVMGRKTFESLGRILPNRKHVLITHQNLNNKDIQIYHSVTEFLNEYDENGKVFIIGGGSIYKEFINYVDEMYLTHIEASSNEADTFFPNFNEDEFEKEILGENIDNNIKYKHIYYRRKK